MKQRTTGYLTMAVSAQVDGRMRTFDKLICAQIFVIGILWFLAAEFVYDGSLMEDPFLRSGMAAMYYVPLATLYLVKTARGEGRRTSVIAGVWVFLVQVAMIAVNVWTTHFKPDCDVCHMPAGECFAMETVVAAIFTALVVFSDVWAMRLITKIRHPLANFWLARRILRVVATFVLTCISFVVTLAALYVVLRIVWLVVKLLALAGKLFSS